jgi:FKBP-type peptidyl-prolyl cis-trans isomerase
MLNLNSKWNSFDGDGRSFFEFSRNEDRFFFLSRSHQHPSTIPTPSTTTTTTMMMMSCLDKRKLFLLLTCLVHASFSFAPSACRVGGRSLLTTTVRTTANGAGGGDVATASPENNSIILEKPPMNADTHEELMYALGVNLARQLGDIRPLVETGDELANVAKGILDTIVGRLSDDGQRDLLARRGQELNTLITDRAAAIKEKMAQEGREMLQKMKEMANDGADIQVLPSGVVLHTLEYGPEGKGHGTRPTKASTVKIHYHGTLANGEVFDSTLVSGEEPVKLPLAGVIPGWRDGVLKMHEGETAMLGIPPDQAYGADGTPDGRIPGDSTLFFKIQLLEVMSAGIGGSATLLGADGQKLGKDKGSSSSSGLLGVDGRPL